MIIAFIPLRLCMSKILIKSAFCASLVARGGGQSILATVATHTPRNSLSGCALEKLKSKNEVIKRKRVRALTIATKIGIGLKGQNFRKG